MTKIQQLCTNLEDVFMLPSGLPTFYAAGTAVNRTLYTINKNHFYFAVADLDTFGKLTTLQIYT